MKKWFTFLTSIMLLICAAIPVSAATDPNDDLSGLTEEIITTSNDLFSDKLSRDITADDIDFSNAFKIYVGTNLFETDVENVAEIPDVFGADGYIYELPIYLDGDTLIINIAKGQPLNGNAEFTDAERQEILDNVGKWQVTAVKYYENEIVDYKTELEAQVDTVTEDAVLVGGLPYFRYAVALLSDDEGAIQSLVPLSDVPGIEKINTLQTESVSNNVYDYEEVKNYVNQLPPVADGEAGAYGFLNVEPAEKSITGGLVAGVIVLIAFLGISIVIYRRKAH